MKDKTYRELDKIAERWKVVGWEIHPNALKDIQEHIEGKVLEGRIDEHKFILDEYATVYKRISKQHGVEQEVPHTAFHQISKDRIKQLKDKGGSDENL